MWPFKKKQRVVEPEPEFIPYAPGVEAYETLSRLRKTAVEANKRERFVCTMKWGRNGHGFHVVRHTDVVIERDELVFIVAHKRHLTDIGEVLYALAQRTLLDFDAFRPGKSLPLGVRFRSEESSSGYTLYDYERKQYLPVFRISVHSRQNNHWYTSKVCYYTMQDAMRRVEAAWARGAK